MLSDGSTISHTMLATARPASTPSALARKVAVACVDSGMLQHAVQSRFEAMQFIVAD
jgi:hypothetical protein